MQQHLAQLTATLAAMPPVVAMGIAVEGFEQDRLTLRAPLSANVNDKGNAFGGSLASVMTLAGWGLVTAQLAAAGQDADVYVADSQVKYLTPVYTDLQATAEVAEGASWETFLARFAERGHASVQLYSQVITDGQVAATLHGRFVARARAA